MGSLIEDYRKRGEQVVEELKDLSVLFASNGMTTLRNDLDGIFVENCITYRKFWWQGRPTILCESSYP